MKKKLITLLLFVLCLTLCGCSADLTPFKPVASNTETQHDSNSSNNNSDKLKIYVGGAVENEGYVEVDYGSTYADLLRLAGVNEHTVHPSNPNKLVTSDTELYLNFYDGDTVCSCVDLNGEIFIYRLTVAGIDKSIINKIADYKDVHGAIHNKEQLKEILGDDYQSNYYKFFVAAIDYQE